MKLSHALSALVFYYTITLHEGPGLKMSSVYDVKTNNISTCANPSKRFYPIAFNCFFHRVGRVLSFFSCRRNWDSPNPSPAGEYFPLLWYREEARTRWGERGWESPNSDEETYTVVPCIYIYTVCTLWFFYIK